MIKQVARQPPHVLLVARYGRVHTEDDSGAGGAQDDQHEQSMRSLVASHLRSEVERIAL